MRLGKPLVLTTLVGLLVCLSTVQAGDIYESFSTRHQVGIRLGSWINRGDSIPTALDFGTNGRLESKIHGGSFYFEGFYAHRIMNQLLLEFSLGVANRGSVTIQEGKITDVGNLMIYPILVNARLYPFGFINSKLQPFILFGGGLYYARQTVQFTNDYYAATYRERSATDFDLSFSTGLDWLLGSNLALEFKGRYSPIHFSKSLLTARDFDAIAVTVGIKYFHKSKDKTK